MEIERKMPENTAHSWAEFLKLIEEVASYLTIRGDVHCVPPEFWYRGLEKSTYALTPSLFRYRNAETKEQTLFHLYTQTVVGNHGHKVVSWETLFEMQHYGIPTRLLDWTVTPINAVFFAVTENRDNPCIYVLNPLRLNKKSSREMIYVPEDSEFDYRKSYWESRPVKILHPLAIVPTYQNPRLMRQQGRFTVHGSYTEPIEQQFPDCVFKIILNDKACIEALEVIKSMGPNIYTLFPDFIGIALFVRSGAALEPIPYDEGTAIKIRDRLISQANHDLRILEARDVSDGPDEKLRTKGINACNLGHAYIHREGKENELEEWLNSDTQPFLFVIGEAGIGKTNFILYCLLCNKKFQNKPFVFIPFKVYGAWLSDNTENSNRGHILDQCLCEHMLEAEPTEHEKNVARKMIAEGDIVIALDGLDELARVKGEETVHTVALELENYVGGSSKARVIISCRDHILERLQGKKILETKNSLLLRIEKFDANRTKQMLSERLGCNHDGLAGLAQIPLFFEMIRRSENYWERLQEVDENSSLLYEAWFHIILEKNDFAPKCITEKMREIGKIAGVILQNRSDLLEASTLDSQLRELVLKLLKRPFAVFVEELKGTYSFSHQSLREFILGWCISNEIKDNQFNLLMSNPSFDYEGGETYQYVHGLLDLKIELIDKLDSLLDKQSASKSQWNNLARNLFEAIGMLMPDEDEVAASAVQKAIDILDMREYKTGHYICYKTKYNIARCIERLHSLAPRDPYFDHILKYPWRTAPRDRDNIGAYAVRGFHMKKQMPGTLPPTVFLKNKDASPAIQKLEPLVSERLISTIENLTDQEIPEDAEFLGINCTLALIRWLPERPDLDRIEELLKHPHMSAPMKQNIFWALFRRYAVDIPRRFYTSGVFKGIGKLGWACDEAEEALRRIVS